MYRENVRGLKMEGEEEGKKEKIGKEKKRKGNGGNIKK